MILYFDNYSKKITNNSKEEMTIEQVKEAFRIFQVKDYNEPLRILRECDFDLDKADLLIKKLLEER